MKNVKEFLAEEGQAHLLRYFDELSDAGKEDFLRQVRQIDWKVIRALHGEGRWSHGSVAPIEGLSLAQIEERKAEYEKVGVAALKSGKVAAVLLAGGMGTRLGSSAPKGTFDIGVTRPLYIFQQLIENLKETCRACGAEIPLLVMTSERNDDQTRAFFREHGFFGYPSDMVRFFVQDMAPCVNFNGKVFLEEKGRIALSPNGNGGWYSSLVRAGLLNDPILKHAEWFNVFAVDNVLQRIADPAFVGATILSGKKCGAKAVKKVAPEERVGVLCLDDGKPSIIEYYELSPETANLRRADGELIYRYGVILNYLFHAETLQKIASENIPVHVVKKKIPYLGDDGRPVSPETENGYKFETLILDLVRLMGNCLPYEVDREKEFAPVKNRTGTDSVDTARALLEKNGVKL